MRKTVSRRQALIAASAVALVPNLARAQDDTRVDTVNTNKAIVREFLERAHGAQDITVVDELVSPDYSSRATSSLPGRDAYKQRLLSAYTNRPDDVLDHIELIIGEDDWVAAIEILKIENGANDLFIPQLGFFRLENGLIIEAEGAFDQAEYQAQLLDS